MGSCCTNPNLSDTQDPHTVDFTQEQRIGVKADQSLQQNQQKNQESYVDNQNQQKYQQQQQQSQQQQQQEQQQLQCRVLVIDDKLQPLAPADWQKQENYMKSKQQQYLETKVNGSIIESVSDPNCYVLHGLQQNENSFAEALRLAYSHHIPLSLSPDLIWLQILQGFSVHVQENAEKLRKYFVEFEGKKELIVYADMFKKGSQENDWQAVFGNFEFQISEFIGEENHKQLAGFKFSTTTPLEKSLFSLSLMNSMKKYFAYVVQTRCGMSKVRLMGTKQDWELLYQKTEGLIKYELSWWIPKLLPILSKFIEQYDCPEDKIDKKFWNCCYKIHQVTGSGANTYVNGWINNFFPYEKKYQRNDLIDLDEIIKNFDRQMAQGIVKGFIPSSLMLTNFIWDYHGHKYQMDFIGGFMGLSMTNEYITPQIGWGVSERVNQSDNNNMDD